MSPAPGCPLALTRLHKGNEVPLTLESHVLFFCLFLPSTGTVVLSTRPTSPPERVPQESSNQYSGAKSTARLAFRISRPLHCPRMCKSELRPLQNASAGDERDTVATTLGQAFCGQTLRALVDCCPLMLCDWIRGPRPTLAGDPAPPCSLQSPSQSPSACLPHPQLPTAISL